VVPLNTAQNLVDVVLNGLTRAPKIWHLALALALAQSLKENAPAEGVYRALKFQEAFFALFLRLLPAEGAFREGNAHCMAVLRAVARRQSDFELIPGKPYVCRILWKWILAEGRAHTTSSHETTAQVKLRHRPSVGAFGLSVSRVTRRISCASGPTKK